MKNADIRALLQGIEVEWVLDDEVIEETERTPIKHFLEPERVGMEKAFGFQDGAFMAPGEMIVGGHTLLANVTDPFGTFTLGPITFNVDATGTGACN